jgi:general transcription factor 3C polypeptide 5 (transcription factor C subunit 1)
MSDTKADPVQQRVDALFKQRPMWTRLALTAQLPEIGHGALKRCLPCSAFYFLHGPWNLLWCRYGYDPRTSSDSRRYQVIDFRMPRNIALSKPGVPAQLRLK